MRSDKEKPHVGPCRVTFLPKDVSAFVERATSIYDASVKAGATINSVCGGQKQCGKCKVVVSDGRVVKGNAGILAAEDLRAGFVLACDTFIDGDVIVEIPPESVLGKGQILEGKKSPTELADDLATKFPFDPLVKKAYVQPEPPSTESNIDDTHRFAMAACKALGVETAEADLRVIRRVTSTAKTNDWKLTATYATLGQRGKIIRVEGGDHETENMGLAVDIGTTTIVVHLIDIHEKRVIDIESKYNSQAKFGEDYIKRIMYAQEHANLAEMQSLIVGDINELLDTVCARNGLPCRDVLSVTTAGNTAMHHFFLNLDPGNIRREPFVPVVNFPPPVRAREIGLALHPRAVIYALPGVSVYVGADITAGVLATGLYQNEELSLHIDIGTNGEIVLGNREWMVCCSASAGPSFEGSGVKHGMRATEGAIEDVEINDRYEVQFATIGGTRPRGICGSGLIDTMAELFKAGLLDRTGTFHSVDGGPVRADEDGTMEFVLVPAEKAWTKRDIVINHIDTQDLLRSKAAIFAAAAILVESMNVKFEDIRHVYIAGGFGNYLNIENAILLGMLPDIPRERIHFVGNTAIEGAKLCLLSRKAAETVHDIAQKMTYFDLMSNYKYMDYYQKALFLPHTDLDLFPSAKRYARNSN